MVSNNLYRLLTILAVLSSMSNFILARKRRAPTCEEVWNDNDGESGKPAKLSTPKECARECIKGAPSKTCYYHFTLEIYTVLGGACSICTTPNDTDSITSDCQCVSADGVERGLLTVNRMLPGPSIEVCKGDKIVVDLQNNMIGMGTTIHWHGIFQKGSQYYDGVPLVTQCAIPFGTTFRYQFQADNEGTHFWHAHEAVQKMDGIHGKLIVRIPKEEDPNGHLYDYDLYAHEMIIEDWTHFLTLEYYPGLRVINTGQLPVSALINGRGRYTDPITGITTNTSLAQFNVEPGYRYRFRIINSFCSSCFAELVFQGHNLTLICVDGVPVKPTKITTMNSWPGERMDVVLETNKPAGDYWIQLRARGGCDPAQVQQLAVLHYSGKHVQTSSQPPTYNASLPKGITLSPTDGICNVTRADAICYNQLTSARPVDKRIMKGRADLEFFFTIGFNGFPAAQIFKAGTYEHFIVPLGGDIFANAMIDNITYVNPPSPPLSQWHDIPKKLFCNETHRPENCSTPCPCTHVIRIPLHSVVEVCMADWLGIPGLSHPFHLHGYAFNVIAMGTAPYKNVKRMNSFIARRMDKEGYIRRRYNRPIYKDTIPIPTGGYTVFRFVADNPGIWFFHCHILFHHISGMEMMFQVGEPKDLPRVPYRFPICGNHLPPIVSNEY